MFGPILNTTFAFSTKTKDVTSADWRADTSPLSAQIYQNSKPLDLVFTINQHIHTFKILQRFNRLQGLKYLELIALNPNKT